MKSAIEKNAIDASRGTLIEISNIITLDHFGYQNVYITECWFEYKTCALDIWRANRMYIGNIGLKKGHMRFKIEHI